MFFNKTNQIIELLNAHINAVLECYESYTVIFSEIVNKQSINDLGSSGAEYTDRIQALEEEADKKRHQVIFQLLQGGFLVDSRKSTMRLVEGVDKIADSTEDIIQMLIFEKIEIKKFLIEPLISINDITHKQLKQFINILSKMVTKYEVNQIQKDIREIEDYETDVDRIEDELIKQLYQSSLPLANKQQLKELIRMISNMSDMIEDLSDEVEIIIASRRI
jgi:predicted phosphate transport protein (TIGR00153 family)